MPKSVSELNEQQIGLLFESIIKAFVKESGGAAPVSAEVMRRANEFVSKHGLEGNLNEHKKVCDDILKEAQSIKDVAGLVPGTRRVGARRTHLADRAGHGLGKLGHALGAGGGRLAAAVCLRGEEVHVLLRA